MLIEAMVATARRIILDILATTMMVTAVAPTAGAVGIAATLAAAATTDAVAMGDAVTMAATAATAAMTGEIPPCPRAQAKASPPQSPSRRLAAAELLKPAGMTGTNQEGCC
jgi:hypothetical protein